MADLILKNNAKGYQRELELRNQRLSDAKVERNMKLYLFQDAYRFALPARNKWYIRSPSYDKSLYWWDSTAVEGTQTFASNIQYSLMPPYQKWCRFTPGRDTGGFQPQEQDSIKKQLDQRTEILFKFLNKSNLYLQSNIVFQDMAVSVGVLMIRPTGERENPVAYTAIPTHECYFEEFDGVIRTVFHESMVPVREIMSRWPKAVLTPNVKSLMDSNPNALVPILQSCIYYPENDEGSRYCYSVNMQGDIADLYYEEYEVPIFVCVRFAVSPGEVWGFGPVMQALGSIRIVNAMKEMELKSAAYKCQKPWLINMNNVMNPWNTLIQAGSPIPVSEINNSIMPVDLAGDLNFSQLSLEKEQAQIRDLLYGNPLGDVQSKDRTATEAEIRTQIWMKRTAASIMRVTNEFSYPVIAITTYWLNKAGIFDNVKMKNQNVSMKIDGILIDLEFELPIGNVQKHQNVQDLVGCGQAIGSLIGQQALLGALNLPEIPSYLADQFNVPSTLVNSPAQIEQTIKDAQAQAQQQQAQEQAQNQPPAPTQVPGQAAEPANNPAVPNIGAFQ